MKLSLQSYITLALAATVIFLLCLRSCESRNGAQLVNSYENQLDTLRNEYNQQVATNRLIVDSYNSLRQVKKTNDSELVKLTRQTISLTLLREKTARVDTGRPVTTFTAEDSARIRDGARIVYPTYLLNQTSLYDSVDISASHDQVRFSYVAYNYFEIHQKWKRSGLFKRESFVEVTNLNPNTQTLGLRSFQISQPRPMRGLWFAAGFLTNSAIMYLQK